MSKNVFNLSKVARRDPPTAFNPYAPERTDPYRMRVGKPGENDTADKLRAGNVPSAINQSSPGGEAWTTNKEWPSDTPLITDFEGRPNDLHGTGIATDNGLTFHDDYEGQTGDSSGESALGIASTVAKQIDGIDRDRKPYNVNMSNSVLRTLRSRINKL
jgi:hypothetical protein